eukprot:5764328-Amphidinium_carterae.1
MIRWRMGRINGQSVRTCFGGQFGRTVSSTPSGLPPPPWLTLHLICCFLALLRRRLLSLPSDPSFT